MARKAKAKTKTTKRKSTGKKKGAKKSTAKKATSKKKRTPPRPKSLGKLKGGLRTYWAAKGVKP